MANNKMGNNGCAYGKVNRTLIENMKETMEKGFNDFGRRLDKIDTTQVDLFNHQSSRIPKDVANKMAWLTGILGTILGGVLIGLVMFLLTK